MLCSLSLAPRERERARTRQHRHLTFLPLQQNLHPGDTGDNLQENEALLFNNRGCDFTSRDFRFLQKADPIVGEEGGMSGWNLNGRYVPDNAAITYRSVAVLEVHELNIKSGEML